MILPFHPSSGFTVGMELEFQLVDPQGEDLADGILPLLEAVAAEEALHPLPGAVKPEVFQCTVEVVSPPAADLGVLEAALRPRLGQLLAVAERQGLALCGGGCHPFSRRPALISPWPRYAAMERAAGWLSHNQVTYATHVHLGVESGEEAVRLMGELKPWLPLLIALSASSPFWHGTDTRFAAFRQRVLAATRSFGPPPDFRGWADFEACFTALRRAARVEKIQDLHWDLRPRPDFGTVEVRVLDAQPTLAEALALAALLRALTRYLRSSRGGGEAERPLRHLPWWVLKDNAYAASRSGLDARVIVTEAGEVAPLREVAGTTLERIRPFAGPGEGQHLESLARAVEGGLSYGGLPYERMRRCYGRTGSMQAVVREGVEALRDGLA